MIGFLLRAAAERLRKRIEGDGGSERIRVSKRETVRERLFERDFPEMSLKQKISMLICRLMGWAQDWAAAACRNGGTLISDYSVLQQFETMFDHPDQGQCSAQKLLRLHPPSSMEDYVAEALR